LGKQKTCPLRRGYSQQLVWYKSNLRRILGARILWVVAFFVLEECSEVRTRDRSDTTRIHRSRLPRSLWSLSCDVDATCRNTNVRTTWRIRARAR